MSFSKSKPSNYVTKEQIERARNVDMVEFLERTEGFSVKKSGNPLRSSVISTTAFLSQMTAEGGTGTVVTKVATMPLRSV